MTVTSVGYGDISATPGNSGENVVAIFLVLAGAICWSYVIATFCNVIDAWDPDAREFRSRMDDLNRYMRRNHLSSDVRRRLRDYFHQAAQSRDASRLQGLLGGMSPSLKNEVVLYCNQNWLRRVWFLRGAGDPFLVSLALRIESRLFAPAEFIPPGALYIVHRGAALLQGRILTPGKVWGEDILLSQVGLRRNWVAARAMGFLHVFQAHPMCTTRVIMVRSRACNLLRPQASRALIMTLLDDFPRDFAWVRKRVIFAALRRCGLADRTRARTPARGRS